MRTKKQTLRRITLLYVVFFVVIAISLVLSFSSAFSEGFNTTYRDAYRMREQGNARIVYDLPGKTSDMDFNIPVYSAPDGSLTINARPSKIDIEAVSKESKVLGGEAGTTVFLALSTIAYIAIFVIIFMILRSLRRSIRTGEMFDKSNIARTRLTGILLICGSLLMSLTTWLESRAAASYFEGSDLAVNTSFPFNFTEIIIGVLIFVIAEVFAIGYSISEEQKLTI